MTYKSLSLLFILGLVCMSIPRLTLAQPEASDPLVDEPATGPNADATAGDGDNTPATPDAVDDNTDTTATGTTPLPNAANDNGAVVNGPEVSDPLVDEPTTGPNADATAGDGDNTPATSDVIDDNTDTTATGAPPLTGDGPDVVTPPVVTPPVVTPPVVTPPVVTPPVVKPPVVTPPVVIPPVTDVETEIEIVSENIEDAIEAAIADAVEDALDENNAEVTEVEVEVTVEEQQIITVTDGEDTNPDNNDGGNPTVVVDTDALNGNVLCMSAFVAVSTVAIQLLF